MGMRERRDHTGAYATRRLDARPWKAKCIQPASLKATIYTKTAFKFHLLNTCIISNVLIITKISGNEKEQDLPAVKKSAGALLSPEEKCSLDSKSVFYF